MQCNLCQNRSQFKLLYNKDKYNIIKCQNCGLVFREKLPNRDELINIYSDEYFAKIDNDKQHQGYLDYLKDEEFLRINFKRRLKQIGEYKTSGNLLDVGCAAGFFLNEAARIGWRVEGVEISKTMANYGQANLHLNIFNGAFQDYKTNRMFDVITMWDYIEHSTDPMADIKKAYSLLQPNGIIALSTGDIASLMAKICRQQWHLLTPHHHLFYFDRKTIKKLLESNGFRVLRISRVGNYYSLKYLCHKIMPYSPAFLKNLLNWIAKTTFGKILVYLNLFDIMTIYAVKL